MRKTLGILLISLIALIICFTMINNKKEKYNDIKEQESINVFVDESLITDERIEVLRKEFDNRDIKAVISSESLGLNSMVLQTDNNNYYMDHNVNKNKDIVGSIFMDYRNNFNSKKILIYGHNSKTIETEFGKLTKYLSLDFTKNNPYIELITDKEKTKWKVFSVMIVPNNTTTHTRIEFSNIEQLQDHINWMKNNSVIDLNEEISINDSFMTLQTCYYEPKDSFLLVNLKKVGDNIE